MEEKSKAPTASQVAATVENVKSLDPGLGSYNFDNLGSVVQFSDLMSKAGEMLPQHLQNRPALCMAVTMRATHWGFDPFALAMETFQAKPGGPIGYQAKVFTAALTSHGVKLRYRYEGEIKILDTPVKSYKGNEIAKRTATGDRKCIAYIKDGDDVLEYETMTLDQITIKNSPLWHNDPDQQLAYAAGRGWARRYRPDIIMGAYSADEVQEMEPVMKDITPKRSPFEEKIAAARAKAQQKDQQEEADTATESAAEEQGEAEAEQPHWTEEIDTSGAFPGDTKFTDGQAAHSRGVLRQNCPCEDHEDAINWLAGWDEAAKQSEGEE